MGMALIISVFGILGIFFIYQLIKFNFNRQKTAPAVVAGNQYLLTKELPQEEVWWALLDSPVQLEMSLTLARKALPAWQKYCEINEPVYRNSSSGPFIKINEGILHSSIKIIEEAGQHGFPAADNIHISRCYNEFVAPLIAMQDGDWAITYTAKKVFMGVYNILKAITEQENITAMKSLLSLSINQSLDCLDMSKMYSREEIKSFLQSYRNQTTLKMDA